ncbi:hypothetical protein TREMEDRAFT_67366 [Tremella mesenterica DSM 1558]|uniref:uncharacterized protein n=1 Tax=Tremella mesenterica (strain ATCC 24925 / CBS 8224 / DSM 1558 / NBRC 9311 / NRRL Y-6157 / RJB 2259-6 / UBC 559-6) TaxID=578456 RepID=UPI0003F48EF1|nr:uncharacterized protein TREMEDRAFT_67366 [Tremella mesenterica DSM 1558]EIW73435.1 hypothetical protein TREMEDRAFT_67366 [Tremella mesenterica DSM 1558]
MSATLAPSTLSPNNPITSQSIHDTFSSLGVKCPEGTEKDYTSLLTGIWEIWNTIDSLPDYVPVVDEVRFPRENIHRATGEENKSNAWAWKATVKDTQGTGGVLEGKTVCLKDNVALKGVPMLLGTDIFRDYVPNTDATVVKRILEAGGVITGKAVCENLSMWGVSISSATGPIDNPHAPGYSAGGSSSGTGALLALGEVDLGIGGDQGGSIRIPACVNGIIGLKPTYGLVPYTAIASLEPLIDHAGPMTKTILDNALLLKVIAGYDGIDDRAGAGCPLPGQVPDYPTLAKGGVKGLKIGILKEGFDQPLRDERVSELVLKAAQKLTELGASVEEVSIPFHKTAPELWAVIGRMSAAKSMLGQASGRRGYVMNDLDEKALPLTQDKIDKMWCSGVNTIMNGVWAWEHAPPGLFGKATNLVRKLRDAYNEALATYDVLITPTMPYLAQKLPEKGASVGELMTNSTGVSLNTSAFNLTGLPALSMPVGFLPSLLNDGARLPVGMQIVGKAYDEGTMYAIGHAWEEANDWKTFT